MDNKYLSFSQISTYLKCPKQYEFKYIIKEKRDISSIAMVQSRAIHKAIEIYYRDKINSKEQSKNENINLLKGIYNDFLNNDKDKIIIEDQQELVEAKDNILDYYELFYNETLSKRDRASYLSNK